MIHWKETGPGYFEGDIANVRLELYSLRGSSTWVWDFGIKQGTDRRTDSKVEAETAALACARNTCEALVTALGGVIVWPASLNDESLNLDEAGKRRDIELAQQADIDEEVLSDEEEVERLLQDDWSTIYAKN